MVPAAVLAVDLEREDLARAGVGDEHVLAGIVDPERDGLRARGGRRHGRREVPEGDADREDRDLGRARIGDVGPLGRPGREQRPREPSCLGFPRISTTKRPG